MVIRKHWTLFSGVLISGDIIDSFGYSAIQKFSINFTFYIKNLRNYSKRTSSKLVYTIDVAIRKVHQFYCRLLVSRDTIDRILWNVPLFGLHWKFINIFLDYNTGNGSVTGRVNESSLALTTSWGIACSNRGTGIVNKNLSWGGKFIITVVA